MQWRTGGAAWQRAVVEGVLAAAFAVPSVAGAATPAASAAARSATSSAASSAASAATDAGKVDAVAALALAKSSGCLACHALQQKKIGPSYAAIAARYANNPKAAANLQHAILHGESGTWGVIPMPAYGGSQKVLTPAQAQQLARWILILG